MTSSAHREDLRRTAQRDNENSNSREGQCHRLPSHNLAHSELSHVPVELCEIPTGGNSVGFGRMTASPEVAHPTTVPHTSGGSDVFIHVWSVSGGIPPYRAAGSPGRNTFCFSLARQGLIRPAAARSKGPPLRSDRCRSAPRTRGLGCAPRRPENMQLSGQEKNKNL